jgi:hypothetical protein
MKAALTPLQQHVLGQALCHGRGGLLRGRGRYIPHGVFRSLAIHGFIAISGNTFTITAEGEQALGNQQGSAS